MRWVADNFDRIQCSFEVLEELQNRHRPFANGDSSYPVVDRNIRLLDKLGANYIIVPLVLPGEEHLMPRMVERVNQHYNSIKYSISFEHATYACAGCGMVKHIDPTAYKDGLFECNLYYVETKSLSTMTSRVALPMLQ